MQFSDPDKFLGHLSYRLAHSDSYLMGPLAQLNKVNKGGLEVPARLVSEGIEYNFEKLQGMGIDDAAMQFKGLVVHQALLHMERRRMLTGGLPQYEAVADLASELATWHKLEHDRWKVSDKFPKPGHLKLPDHLSMEEYFKLLIKEAEKTGVDLNQFMQPMLSAGQGEQGKGEGEGEGQGAGQEEQKGPTPSQQLAQALGAKEASEYHQQDHTRWHQVSKMQQEAVQAILPGELERWMKSRGAEPAGLKRLVNEIFNVPKEKWYDRLRNLVGNRIAIQKHRWTLKRPSRRYGTACPGRIRTRRGALAVAIDTSGSIGAVELDIFISKLFGIAKAYEMPFEVIICDADIHAIKKIAKKRDIDTLEIKGGGGTSSKPVFKHLKKRPVDLLVYLTDLYIDFPDDKPPFRVIWGVINRDDTCEAPFGETHHLTIEGGK